MSMEKTFTIAVLIILIIICLYLKRRLKRSYRVKTAICIDSHKEIDASLDGSVSYKAKYRWIDNNIEYCGECLALFKPTVNKECKIYVNEENNKIIPYNHGNLLIVISFFLLMVGLGILIL